MSKISMLCAVMLLSACAVLQQLVLAPDIHVTDMSLEKAGIFEQVMKFDLRLDNPNAFGLPLAAMQYTLELGGVEIGTGEQTQAVALPANGTANWPVTFRVNSLKLAQGFMERGNFADLDYRIFGKFRFSDSANMPVLPFDKRGKIGD